MSAGVPIRPSGITPSLARMPSVSIGVSLVNATYHWNEAYARADQALYEAKRLGGNRAQWFAG